MPSDKRHHPTVAVTVLGEEIGVIRGYRVDLDPKAMGLPLSAIVRIRPAPG